MNEQELLMNKLLANEILGINDWEKICRQYTLSEDVIREFKNQVDWDCITIYQKLSESFIEEFLDKLNWEFLCERQILSDNFLEKHWNDLDKLHYLNISYQQKLSKKFILKHKDEIYLPGLAQNKYIKHSIVKKLYYTFLCYYYKKNNQTQAEFLNLQELVIC